MRGAETLTKHEIGKTPRENAMMDAEHSRSYSVRLKLAVENFLGGANKVLHFHVALPSRQETRERKKRTISQKKTFFYSQLLVAIVNHNVFCQEFTLPQANTDLQIVTKDH